MNIATSKQATMFLCMRKFWETTLFLHARTLSIPAEHQFFCYALTRAKIPTAPFLVTDSVTKIMAELKLPVVVFAVNPFIYEGYQVAKNKSALYRTMKSLGMNYKFTVCAQPLMGEMFTIKSFLGKSQIKDEQISAITEKVYELFKIPICKLHVQKAEGKAFLCGLEPLKEKELSKKDRELISKEIMLISQQGEHIGV